MQHISLSVVQVCTVRYLHIAWISIILVIGFFYFFLNVLLEVELLVQKPPRYLTSLLISIRSPWALSGSGDIFLSCVWDMKRMYSLLSGFILRCIMSVQHFICLNVSSRSVLVCCSWSLLPAFKFL